MTSSVFEFLETIPPTPENALAIQQLTFQDVVKGGFPNPETIADPSNRKMVETQLAKLERHPERYCGYYRDGWLRAYMKHAVWRVADEAPFASPSLKYALQRSRGHKKNLPTAEWGVFGLVVSDSLDESLQHRVLEDLLRYPTTDPLDGTPRTVNVVIHDHDPLLKVAAALGFVALGERAEVEGAPGLKQQRYKRQASS